MRALWLAGVVFLAGCSLAPSDKVLEALAQSERSWCITIAYGPGMFRGGGTGIQGGSMSCTNDGLTVSDTAAKIGVPILVVPQVSVGAPTTK
jgi:hypothetical protein